MPAASSALSRNRPAGRTKGRPSTASRSPGCSPTSITVEGAPPSPNTVWVALACRSQASQSSAAAARLGIVSCSGSSSSAGLPTPSRLRWTWMDLDSLPAQLRPVLNALAAAGERMTVAALRTLPARTLTGPSTHLVGRVLSRVLGRRAVGAVVRVAPLAVGMAAGAGFDWLAVTALGRAAIRYYGPGGPAVKALPPHGEDRAQIESGH